jgi:hypothetical protein
MQLSLPTLGRTLDIRYIAVVSLLVLPGWHFQRDQQLWDLNIHGIQPVRVSACK